MVITDLTHLAQVSKDLYRSVLRLRAKGYSLPLNRPEGEIRGDVFMSILYDWCASQTGESA